MLFNINYKAHNKMPSKNPSDELTQVPVPTSNEALVEAVAQEKRPRRADSSTDTSGAMEVVSLKNGTKVVRW